MNILKSIKSNIGFIITLVFMTIIIFNPDAKAFVMSGLMKTGLFTPDVSNMQPKAAEEEEVTSKPLVDAVSFTSSDGKTIDLAKLKGKVVFLNFWTTWCPPCIAEMPSVNSLYNKLKNNSNVIFVLADADGDLENSTAFMKKKNFDLPVYIPAGQIPEQLFRGSLPTTVIINKKGEIVYSHEGMANYDSPEIEKLLTDLAK